MIPAIKKMTAILTREASFITTSRTAGQDTVSRSLEGRNMKEMIGLELMAFAQKPTTKSGLSLTMALWIE